MSTFHKKSEHNFGLYTRLHHSPCGDTTLVLAQWYSADTTAFFTTAQLAIMRTTIRINELRRLLSIVCSEFRFRYYSNISRALKVALPVVGPQLHHDYHFETFKFRLGGEHTKAMSEVKRSSVNSLTTHIDIIYLSPYIAIQHNLPILRHNDQLYSRQSSLVRRTR